MVVYERMIDMRKRQKRKQEVHQTQEVKKSKKHPLSWLLAVFLLLSCLTYFPSISSILFLANMILVLPIGKVQDGLKNIFPKKVLKTVLCWVIFITRVYRRIVAKKSRRI